MRDQVTDAQRTSNDRIQLVAPLAAADAVLLFVVGWVVYPTSLSAFDHLKLFSLLNIGGSENGYKIAGDRVRYSVSGGAR